MKKLRVGQNYDIISSSCIERGKFVGYFESIKMQFGIFTTKRKKYYVLCAIDLESEIIVALSENAYIDSYEEACETFTRKFKANQGITPGKVAEYVKEVLTRHESSNINTDKL